MITVSTLNVFTGHYDTELTARRLRIECDAGVFDLSETENRLYMDQVYSADKQSSSQMVVIRPVASNVIQIGE